MARWILSISWAASLAVAAAQSPAPPQSVKAEAAKAEPVKTEPVKTEPGSLATLRALAESITALRSQLDAQNAKARSGESDAVKEAARKEAESLQRRLDVAQRDFDTVATGVDTQEPAVAPGGKFDLAAEFNELIGPMIQELKQATEQPRVIERMRGDLRAEERRLQIAQGAVVGTDALLKAVPRAKDGTPDAAVRKSLLDLQRKWQAMEREARGKLEATRHRLNEALANRKSLWEIISQAARGFLLTRGLNLLLAVVMFFLAYIGWRAMHRWVTRFSPWHRAGADRPFIARVLDVVYHAMAFAVGVLVALVVLYAVGDWVLLGLSLIALLALLLVAKNSLPRYYTQARLLLNLGEVREGERVVVNGLPWQVRSLNMFTDLVNPALRHGSLRVPLTSLANLSSRPCHPGDLWFPCKEDDWVQLADGTFGKVVSATPEFVQLVQLGGAHRTYTTPAFLSQNPVNYAGGFRVTAIVKTHPDHRALATKEIPEAMRESILAGLVSIVEPSQVRSLKVEFRAVIPNALEFDVTADFAGDVADKLPALQHALQHHALAACNEHQWRLGA